MPQEQLNHECAVVGAVHTHQRVAPDIVRALQFMENRGRQSCGISTINNGEVLLYKNIGSPTESLVGVAEDLPGLVGSGHGRYANTGGDRRENAQPFLVDSDLGPFSLVHNGNLVNASHLKAELEADGIKFSSSSDSEVLAQLIAHSPGRTLVERIKSAVPKINGAYSYVIATHDKSLIAGRDPYGVWPLVWGKYKESGAMVASEVTAIRGLKGQVIEYVKNGQIVTFKDGGVYYDETDKKPESNCIFEFVYFSGRENVIHGRNVSTARFEMGRTLFKELGFKADYVIPVPNSAIPAARGYSFESRIPYLPAIRKLTDRRTFMEATQQVRDRKAESAYDVDPDLAYLLTGKDVIIVDDSIVRLTTGPVITNLLNFHGVSNIDGAIQAMVSIDVCHLGVDISKKNELAAHRLGGIEGIRAHLGLRRLGYLSEEGLINSVNIENGLCMGCFTGNHPMPVPKERDRLVLERI